MDHVSHVEGDKIRHDVKPRPGDVTICINCTNFLVFEDESLNLRQATEEDLERYDSDYIHKVRAALKEAKRQTPLSHEQKNILQRDRYPS